MGRAWFLTAVVVTMLGYLAVKSIVAHIRGEPVEKRIAASATLVTQENLSDPEIAALAAPVK